MATAHPPLEPRGLAVVTGASSGIGLELARCAAEAGYDLVIAADEPEIMQAAGRMAVHDIAVHPVEADLSTSAGVDRLMAVIAEVGKPVDLLMANAGRGLGRAFLDKPFEEIRRVVDTDIVGTLDLVHRVGKEMRRQGAGKILFTGSIAGYMPGSYQAVYNGTKAFIDNFSYALREELKDTGVSVTCLMPGPTETAFFERADLLDTKVGQQDKDDPRDVARLGFQALMKGEGGVVAGWSNKLQTALANVTPAETLARQHAKLAKPQGSPS